MISHRKDVAERQEDPAAAKADPLASPPSDIQWYVSTGKIHVLHLESAVLV
jgi:hypothetical protein